MLAIHAFFRPTDATLGLWAEDPERYGQRSRATGHPFAATHEALHHALAAWCPGVTGDPETADLHLPSTATSPAPSPQLWVDAPLHATAIAPWRVPCLSLNTWDAIDALLALDARPDGFVLGDDTRWLTRTARFALDLCARGRVVPALRPTKDRYEALWSPDLRDPHDLARRAALRRGLPPAVRASAPGHDPARLADEVLAALVDGCVAEALADTPLSRGRGDQAADRWLTALSSDDPVLPKSTTGLKTLALGIARWAPPTADGPRVCFRVVAPDDPEAAWGIDFLLQAADDPSDLRPAGDVWRSDRVDDAQERLLAGLGRASKLAPVLAAALREPTPIGCAVGADQAWAFLRGAPALIDAGFGVLTPPWWSRPKARLGVRLQASPQADSVGGLGLDAIVDVRWEVALGDDPIPLAELRRLARQKVPLVQVRGQWVELRPEDVAAALAVYGQAASTATARDVLRQGLGLAPPPGALPVVGIDAAGWLGALLADAGDARVVPVAAPPGFGTTLRPYQERGVGFLRFLEALGLGACLADDMGLGKTVQILALLAHERVDGATPAPTLLVCPMSLVGNWRREAARFVPGLRVAVHHGVERAARGAFAATVAGADLVLTTYALAARDADRLGEVTWGRLVLDEAQNVKNASTQQAKAVAAIRAPKRIALTGTPVENRLSELWSILEFLNPGLLGTAASFRTQFGVPIERYGDVDAAARLRRITAPFVLRRVKTDKAIIDDLPDKLEMNVTCTLTREQATLYQAVVDELLQKVEALDGEARRGAVLGAMTKLKQVCDHPALLLQDRSALPGRSGKLEQLEQILGSVVANGERALVFTQFTELGPALKAHLQEVLGREVLYLHGGTSRAARDALVARFAAPDGPPVFLLSLKAAGTGLNLVAANHVVHFDRWWNPAVEDQATDRAFRIGQTRGVQVRKLVCAGTLEERIDAMIERKRALSRQAVGSGEAWLADLSTQAIRALVALDLDAVGDP